MNRGNHSKSRGSKALVLVLAMVLLMGAAIGGTIAWLTDRTAPVVNTFPVGNIDIELDEGGAVDNKQSFKMIPGYTIAKKPYVTVKGGSEACWVFVKVDESTTLDSYISYTVDSANWTALDGHDGVYYKEFTAAITADTTIDILTGDQVTVKDNVTKAMMDDLNAEGAVQPTLTFTAYACQHNSGNETAFTPAEAWAKVNT